MGVQLIQSGGWDEITVQSYIIPYYIPLKYYETPCDSGHDTYPVLLILLLIPFYPYVCPCESL